MGEADDERGVEALEEAEPGIELSLEFLFEEGLLCDSCKEANSFCASVGMIYQIVFWKPCQSIAPKLEGQVEWKATS